jgi:UDP-N-acetylmuramoyl-tripeptide--D-alanyl-D-alanine ligase
MDIFNLIFSLAWLIVIFKTTLFFVYLWQLKNYRFKRFISHFQTVNGKGILLSKWRFAKIFFLGLYFIYPFFIFGYLAIILVEAALFLRKFLANKLIKPTLTKKAVILIGSSFFFYGLIYLLFYRDFNLYILLMILDILSLLVISFVVLGLEPISIYGRKRIIKKATQKIASFKNLKVIGITGSYGKSTTKEVLSFLLEKKFKVLKTPENLNTEMGVSKTVLNGLKEDHEIFVCEMGAYVGGEIKTMTDIVKPSIGILTGINSQHLSLFGSQENIIKTKYELIESLPEDGLALFNGSNDLVYNLYQKTEKNKKMFSVSKKEESDIWAEDIEMGKEILKAKILTKEESFNLEIKVSTKELIGNILSAVLVAKELGMSFIEISERLKEFNGTGMELKKNSKGVDVLNSTYSSNLDGMMSHISHLNKWEGKKVVVFKPLIELGSSAKDSHIALASKMAEACDLVISTSGEFFNEMKEEAIKKGFKPSKFVFTKDINKIKELISDFKEGDVVLLENRIDKKIIDTIND